MREHANVPTGAGGDESGHPDLELPTEEQVAAAVGGFAMLADPTRLRLLWILGAGDYDVGTLARLTNSTFAATSQHLAKLRLAGLVSVTRDSRRHIYSARDSHVRGLIREALYHADHHVSGQPHHGSERVLQAFMVCVSGPLRHEHWLNRRMTR